MYFSNPAIDQIILVSTNSVIVAFYFMSLSICDLICKLESIIYSLSDSCLKQRSIVLPWLLGHPKKFIDVFSDSVYFHI